MPRISHSPAGTAALLLSLVALAPAAAQDRKADSTRSRETRIYVGSPGAGALTVSRERQPRAVLGVTTSASGSKRDTLGVLVSGVTTGSPAEKAGIEEGNRIQAINGVNLRIAAADVEDPDMNGIAQRRLTRELGKVKPGDDVELRVYGGGQSRTVRVKTANSEDLYQRTSISAWREEQSNRASLGIGLGSNGSARDTLGVLVTAADDAGPAAKAGIYEGARIAEINGVNLRVSKEDIEDRWVSSTRAQRLQREMRKVKAGDDVTLKVWQDGQLRTVRVKTVKASDLPRQPMMFIGDGMAPMPPMPPMAPMPRMPAMAPMPEIRLEGLREFKRELPRLRMQLEGLRDEIRVAPGRRLIVSV